MTVWIVTRDYDYEGSDVDSAFSTEEKALRYIAAKAREGISSGMKLVHFEMTVDKNDVAAATLEDGAR
jgi:hypothetical protein